MKNEGNLGVSIGGLFFEHPLMNGAGICKNRIHAEELIRSTSAGIVLGSITMEPRFGNDGRTEYPGSSFYLNSLGMPNKGIEQYCAGEIQAITQTAKEAQKPLIASVAGFTPEEYVTLTSRVIECGVDMVELNFGCPNVWGAEGDQKKIVSYDPHMIRKILRGIEKLNPAIPISIKLSPLDPDMRVQVAAAISPFECVKAVTLTNTFPSAFAYEKPGKPAIAFLEGFAGMSGPALLPISLGNVKQFRSLLPERIDIIGAGGINSGRDMYDFIQAGATAVQVVTAILTEKVQVLSQILREYTEVIEEVDNAEKNNDQTAG